MKILNIQADRLEFYDKLFFCAAKNQPIKFGEPIYFDGNEMLSFEAGQELLTPRITDETYDLIERDNNPRYFILYKYGYDLVEELERQHLKRGETNEKI